MEVLHRLMLIEAVTRGLIAAGNVARRLRERPDVVRQLDAYHQFVQAIPAMGIEILPAEGESLNLSHDYCRKYGLLVNDSVTVALMERNRIRCLASVDEDFRPVAEIAVFSPSDLAPASGGGEGEG